MYIPTAPLLFLLLALTSAAPSADADGVKRVPTGFMGVRGKKDASESYNDVDKRGISMGFHGMRGKKDEQDFLQENDPFDKRGNNRGFHGMRGKKDQDLEQDVDYFEKRGYHMGFQGVRGKKDQDVQDADYMDKRARSMGFQGVRGKKVDNSMDENDYFADEKRILDLSALQGRKQTDYEMLVDEEDEPDDVWQEELDNLNKRAPKGFFGMRGKKVSAGFFGVRGKKGVSNAFFGVRGKKAPTVGFFGVRGKKSPVDLQGVAMKDDQDIDSLLYYLTDAIATDNGNFRDKRYQVKGMKKMPLGFMGMRGKKNWDTVMGQGVTAEQNSDGGIQEQQGTDNQ